MLKMPLALACGLFLSALVPAAGNADAEQTKKLSAQEMERLVHEVSAAQDKATVRGATIDDVERLYAMYTDDFVYEHPMMDDVYTRQHLHGNHIRALSQGRYEKNDPAEYSHRIVNVMYGENAAAVLRTSARRGDARLAVFEFENGKVARIREYWNY